MRGRIVIVYKSFVAGNIDPDTHIASAGPYSGTGIRQSEIPT